MVVGCCNNAFQHNVMVKQLTDKRTIKHALTCFFLFIIGAMIGASPDTSMYSTTLSEMTALRINGA